MFKNNVMKQILVYVAMLLIVACNNTNQNSAAENTHKPVEKVWNFKRVDGTFLVFNDNSRINTRLFELTYLESLADSNGITYFVVSGRTCKECDENISIFIISPTNTIKSPTELSKYTYPGKEFDYENNELIFESRLFVGNCINKDRNSICLVWVQKEKNINNELDSSIFIVDIFNGKIRERKLLPKTQEYFSNLQCLKNCREIKGIEITSEP